MKRKVLVGILSVTMVASMLTGCGNVTDKIDTDAPLEAYDDVDSDDVEEAEKLSDIIATQVGGNSDGIDKEESVYVVADANGMAQNVIVSDWLKNKNAADTLTDSSDLTDITNVKGEETFEDNNGEIVWQAAGSDIYYQGHTDKALPVDVKVTYYLNGVETAAEDMVGKSGNVTIRFDYNNNEKVTADINGRESEVYVPFTVMSALMLPTDRFADISVTNGKVMSEGNNNIVMGLAFPGLIESLDLDKEKLEEKDIKIPDYVEVNAVTNDFALDMTLSVVLSDALSDIHLTDSIDLSELDDSMDELTDATGQLEDGTAKLADGVQELNDKTGEFGDGAKKLYDGVVEYTNGVGEVANGVDKLSSGAGELSTGASKLSEGAKELNSKVQAISLPDGVTISDEQINGIKQMVAADTDGQISGGAGQLASGIAAGVETKIKAGIDNDTTRAALAASISAALQSQAGIPQPQADALAAGIAASATSTIASNISVPAGSISEDGSIAQGCYGALLTAAQNGAVGGAKGVATEVGSQLGSFGGMVTQLKDATKQISDGASQLATGANTLNGGVAELKNGVGKLNSNSGTLVDGAHDIYDATGKLSDGVSELLTGANDLNDGMIKFDNEGISKLTDAFEGDGKKVVDRLDATMDAAKNYHTFTSLADGQEGNVKFIIRTQAVK